MMNDTKQTRPSNKISEEKNMIEIKETTVEELKNVQRLWADGDVMKFVGFPEGIRETDENMQKWIQWTVENRPRINDFSIFEDGVYCGEASYEIDEEHKSASLDIKLFAFARGRGIATKALSFAIKEAFENGAETVWVDPNPENVKALALYDRLGFVQKEMPQHVIEMGEDPDAYVYLELKKEQNKFSEEKTMKHIYELKNKNLQLEKINADNFLTLYELEVSEEQQQFVASNRFSMAEAYARMSNGQFVQCFGICDGDTPVGFAMIGHNIEDEGSPESVNKCYLLWRIMIGQQYQRRGYGRDALHLLLDWVLTFPDGPSERFSTSYEPTNEVAKRLYTSFGFIPTGEKDCDDEEDAEDVAVLPLTDRIAKELQEKLMGHRVVRSAPGECLSACIVR